MKVGNRRVGTFAFSVSLVDAVLTLLQQMRINNMNGKGVPIVRNSETLIILRILGSIVLPEAISNYVLIVVKNKGVI